jgi:hypothetical protein
MSSQHVLPLKEGITVNSTSLCRNVVLMCRGAIEASQLTTHTRHEKADQAPRPQAQDYFVYTLFRCFESLTTVDITLAIIWD